MANKIYLSPSSQPENTYSAGNTNEQEVCQKIARAADTALKRCGFDTICADYGNMYSRVEESNQWGANLHVPIHTNGFNKKVAGTRIMCHDLKGEGYKASVAVYDVLAPITPGTSENITAHPKLYEIRESKAPCVYIEVDFHDVPEVAQWLIDNTVRIGEAICEGICNHYGVVYKVAEKEEPKNEIYRVQVDFKNEKFALDMCKELKEKGYDAFVTGYWRLK